MPQPLQGLLVLDFSTLLPGPLATLMLAEAGAEVVKVERPGGEDMRRFPPKVGSEAAPFAVLNAGKKTVVADLKTEDGRRSVMPLIERADILVEQFRPGVMERLGLGYAAVRAINPRIVYCSVSGYGQQGPRAGEAGHDINYQALTGLLSLSPTMPAALVADIAGGAMPAVMNILLALRQRDLTGEGCYLDIAMADAMFTFSWFALAEGHAKGRFPGAAENMLAGALEQKFWNAFCEGIALPQELRDDRRDPHATRAAIAQIVAGRDGAAWRAILEPLDCCCTVVVSLEEAVNDPHFRERGLLAYRAQTSDGQGIPLTALPIAPAFRADSAIPRPVVELP
jgi:crotonobetainyl-CoA:carnitine CoA-transferase CaiB-like acyl-CoA transferase